MTSDPPPATATDSLPPAIRQRLDDLIARAPAELRPLARQYGPTLAAWTAEELWDWIDLLMRGRWQEAHETLLAGMSEGDLLEEFRNLTAELAAANIDQARKRHLLTEAATAVLRGVLVLAVSLVGL